MLSSKLPVQNPKDYKKPEIPEKYKVSLVQPESFRVYRKVQFSRIPERLKPLIPKPPLGAKAQKGFKSPEQALKGSWQDFIYVTRAVTFDKCYYEKYTWKDYSEAPISKNKYSSWTLVGSYGAYISPEQCQRNLLDDGWLFIPPLKFKKPKIKKVKEPEATIYEAFTPEALLERVEEEERPIEELLPQLVPQPEVKPTVKPVIRHVRTTSVDKSLSALDIALRLEARKTAKLERKLELAERLEASILKQQEEAKKKLGEKEFRTKKEMLAFIKARLAPKKG